ncbi:AMP-binding protein [Chloroflexota bacterium]
MSPEMTGTTFPKLLREDVEKWGGRVAMRQKQFGIWNEYTWSESYDNTRRFVQGLLALGMEPGDRVCLLGDLAAELYWAIFAAWCNLGISLGIWAGTPAEGVEYILNHSETRFLVVKDQEQVDKALGLKEVLPEGNLVRPQGDEEL